MTEVTQPIEPTLIYTLRKTVYLNIPTWEGLPPWISQDAKRAIFRSLTNAIATNILQWTRPVLVATQLKMNLATQHEKVQTVFLRAMPRYQGIKIFIHIINQTINQINNQINIQILIQILIHIINHTINQINIHIINQTINQINNQISNQISNQILRAMPRYQGIVAHDCVKVWIDEENNEGATIKRVYFGKCIVFLQDSEGKQFVVIQWFNRHETNGFDTISKLSSFKLAPETHTKSFSTVPLTAIINGALLVPGGGRFWALLSPKEKRTYQAV